MKITLLLLISIMSLNAQTREIFRDYNFSSGQYTLYFTSTYDDAPASFKAFYIEDAKHLNEIKTRLQATPSQETMPCDYNYTFYLTINDSVVVSGIMNSDCGSLYIGKEFYRISPFHVFMLKRYGVELLRYYKKFETINDSKRFYIANKNKCVFFPDKWGHKSKKTNKIEVAYLKKTNCIK